jgi:Icc-related predicted phosphoesterase
MSIDFLLLFGYIIKMKKLSFVCISDMHGELPKEVPNGDFLLLAGDLGPNVNCAWSEAKWFDEIFYSWLEALPHKRKIVIAGNHDFAFETHLNSISFPSDVIYLCDSGIVIDGIQFWGSPRNCTKNPQVWAFAGTDDMLAHYWDLIPENIEILLTHTPPKMTLDCVPRSLGPASLGLGVRHDFCGSDSLRLILPKFQNLKLHVFGHIHECAGRLDGDIVSVNAAYLNAKMTDINPIQVVELDSSLFPNYS